MMNISGIVINKNGGKKLAGCLKSLKFCGEILLADSGSTDNSVSIAEKSGARIIQAESSGFSDSRNIGAKMAKGEWLLYVDADERVTNKLAETVLRKINASTHQRINSFRIFRKNIILGRWLRHGGWWPDPVHRLIKKSALKAWKGKLHEYPVVSGEVGLIKEPLVHYSKDSVSDMVQNSRLFAPIEAKLKLKAGHPPVRIYHFILVAWREFWRRGIIGMGWRDGWAGILEVFYQMFHQILVYSILWEMQKKIKN